MSFGCKHSLPHPPTFADFHRLGPGILEDEKRLNAQVALFETAMFLPRDLELIRVKGNPRELIGAALQTKVGDSSIPVLTREAFLHGSNDPVVLTGIAKSLIREIANEVQGARDRPNLLEVLTSLEHLEPGNGLPLCLRAYIQL